MGRRKEVSADEQGRTLGSRGTCLTKQRSRWVSRFLMLFNGLTPGFYKEDGKTLNDAIRTPQQGIAP